MARAIDVADEFLRLAAAAGRRLNAIQLMKLCIIAHGWNLAREGAPLLDEPVEAWAHGPGISALHAALKSWDMRPIVRDANAPMRVSQADARMIAMVDRAYGSLPQSALQGLTNRQGTPWAVTRKGADGPVAIPDGVIRAHYLGLDAARAKKAA